jgi:hypothetical protein
MHTALYRQSAHERIFRATGHAPFFPEVEPVEKLEKKDLGCYGETSVSVGKTLGQDESRRLGKIAQDGR